MTTPKWINPERQNYLASLFVRSQGFCIYGYSPCKGQWQTETITGCIYGKPCNKPVIGDFCPKPNYEHPSIKLPCQLVYKVKSVWKCAYADKACYKPYESHYTHVESDLIKRWSMEDRQATLDKLKVESILLHKTNDRPIPLRGQFSGIAKDIYFDNQPDYFIEAYGLSGLNFKSFAKIRLASSPIRLFVTIEDTFKGLSKNQKHKAVRYGKVSSKLQARIDLACIDAVNHFRSQ